MAIISDYTTKSLYMHAYIISLFIDAVAISIDQV